MNLYDTDEIKRVADCQELMRTEFKVNERQKGRFDCPWRPGSDSGAMAVERDQWFDHVAKEGGDVITLVCKAKEMNFIEANEWLGERYHLTPKTKTREQRKVVAEYIYKDKDGIPLHKKIRYQPKSFSQEHWTQDGWKPGLMKGTDLYYTSFQTSCRVLLQRWVFLVEGKGRRQPDPAWIMRYNSNNRRREMVDSYTDALAGGCIWHHCR